MVACKERARSSRHHSPTGGGNANVWESPNVDLDDGTTFQRRAAAASVGVGQKSRVTEATASIYSAHAGAFGSTIGISEGLGRTRTTSETSIIGNVVSSVTAVKTKYTCSSNRQQTTAAQNIQETAGRGGERLFSRRREEHKNEELKLVPGSVVRGIGIGGGGVGAAAKARLYRGYCEQKAGDYERKYRRWGGKELLVRKFLLTR